MASTARRLGVALLLDRPVSDEVDGLRRALGDPSLGRIPPHITLVPPVNVRADELAGALARLRAAAAGQAGPLQLTLGLAGTFLPDNPVLFLQVGGDLERLRALRDAVFAPPLERPLSWPWVPHVTVADNAERRPHRRRPGRPRPLRHGRLHRPGRPARGRAGPGVVGPRRRRPRSGRRGGPGRPGPGDHPGAGGRSGGPADARATPEPPGLRRARRDPDRPGRALFPIVSEAAAKAQVVGAAMAWRADDGGHAAVFVAPAVRRQGIGGILLRHLEAAVADGRLGLPSPACPRAGWLLPGPQRWAATRRPPRRTEPAS